MEQIVSYHIKRADAGTQRLLTAPTSLAGPADRIISSLEKVYHQRRVQFDNKIDERISARVQEADLMEIFGNLLENACKYGAQVITLESRKSAGMISVTIDDDGPGFPDGSHDQLLKRGERADTEIEGQGIGLSITRELIEGYGGSLAISNNTGGGARITVKLPAGS